LDKESSSLIRTSGLNLNFGGSRLMKRKNIVLVALLIVAANASVALAVDCDEACPEGQVRTGYLDGLAVSCNCVPAANMDDVPEASTEATDAAQEKGDGGSENNDS
jgi:hypothetical protein